MIIFILSLLICFLYLSSLLRKILKICSTFDHNS